MSNQKVWVEVQNGYRLPCPAGCEKEIHDRMMACWRESPRERATFRGLTTYFRNRSFALGTIGTYEIAPTELGSKVASRLNSNTDRAAELISTAVKQGKQRVSVKRATGPKAKESKGKVRPGSLNSSSSSSGSLKPKRPEISETEFGMGENYVDFMGKVRVCVFVSVCVRVCVCVSVCAVQVFA
jgi:hypothetical protein